jgi:hypothetical protein
MSGRDASSNFRCSLLMLITMLVVFGAAWAMDAQAQPSPPPEVSQYFSNGADLLSIPTDQPGFEYFSDGAALTSIPPFGQRGSEYFSQGTEATGTSAAWPGPWYFSHGAEAMSVPPAGQPGSEYFSQGADVMSVPPAGQPGSEYFSQGADVMSDPWLGWVVPPQAPEAGSVEPSVPIEPPVAEATALLEEPAAAPEPASEALIDEPLMNEAPTDDAHATVAAASPDAQEVTDEPAIGVPLATAASGPADGGIAVAPPTDNANNAAGLVRGVAAHHSASNATSQSYRDAREDLRKLARDYVGAMLLIVIAFMVLSGLFVWNRSRLASR